MNLANEDAGGAGVGAATRAGDEAASSRSSAKPETSSAAAAITLGSPLGRMAS